jgi:hypothetical protein
MSTKNVTYENNHFIYHKWSSPFLVNYYAKDGQDGQDGQGGGEAGPQGKQGLVGPVIRFRGQYSTSNDVIYRNDEGWNPEDPITIRYIDIVFYNNKYYKLKPLDNESHIVRGSTDPAN